MTTDQLAQALRSGEAAPEGVPSQDWDNARRVLTGEGEAAALPPLLALAVLEVAVDSRTPGPAERLSGSADRAVAKAARRALYRLRSAGVPVATAERPSTGPVSSELDTKVSNTSSPSSAAFPAFVSLPDGTGQRGLLVAQPLRGGVELVEALVSDELGLLALTRAEMARGGWRKLTRSPELERLLPIPIDTARGILSEALRWNLETRTPFPADADVALRHLGVEVAQSEPPPLPDPEDGDAALAVEGGTLHGEPELAAWLPPEAELKRLALRIDELRTSPLALTQEQQSESLRERIHGQAEEFFTPERMRLYARRLWQVVPALERRGATHGAAVARAAARRMFHHSPGLFPPFAEQLFTKVLALMARAGQQPSAAAPRPTQSQAAPTAPPGERRSPGGLILP
jgi:hypothetical protein